MGYMGMTNSTVQYFAGNSCYSLGVQANLKLNEVDDGYQHIQFAMTNHAVNITESEAMAENTYVDSAYYDGIATGNGTNLSYYPSLDSAGYYAKFSHYESGKNTNTQSYRFPVADVNYTSAQSKGAAWSSLGNTVGDLIYQRAQTNSQDFRGYYTGGDYFRFSITPQWFRTLKYANDSSKYHNYNFTMTLNASGSNDDDWYLSERKLITASSTPPH